MAVNNDFGCVRKRFCPNLRFYSCICLVGQREAAKNLGQNNLSPGRYLNPRPPEQEAFVVTTKFAVSSFIEREVSFYLMTLQITQFLWRHLKINATGTGLWWNYAASGQLKNSKKYLSHCHCVYHKSLAD
jgi:hypothetical protein